MQMICMFNVSLIYNTIYIISEISIESTWKLIRCISS